LQLLDDRLSASVWLTPEMKRPFVDITSDYVTISELGRQIPLLDPDPACRSTPPWPRPLVWYWLHKLETVDGHAWHLELPGKVQGFVHVEDVPELVVRLRTLRQHLTRRKQP